MELQNLALTWIYNLCCGSLGLLSFAHGTGGSGQYPGNYPKYHFLGTNI